MLNFDADATDARGTKADLLVHNVKLGQQVWASGVGGRGSGSEDLWVSGNDGFEDVGCLCPTDSRVTKRKKMYQLARYQVMESMDLRPV